MRKILFWAHLIAGLTAGLFLFAVALSGAVLSFEPQVREWADRPFAKVAPGAARLGAGALAQKAKEAYPQEPLHELNLFSAPDKPALALLGKDKRLYLDPYSGAVLGLGPTWANSFFKATTALHRYFLFQDAGKDAAHQVKNAANFLFFIMLWSGLFLWWQQKALKPRFDLKGKAGDFNRHNALGFWALPFLMLISGTGLVMSYDWATKLLYTATGTEMPARKPPQPRPKEAGKPEVPSLDAAAALKYVKAADAAAPGWFALTLRPPRAGSDTAMVNIQTADLPLPQGRGTLTLDARTAAPQKWEPYESQNAGRRARLWSRHAHTGQAFGVIGQLLALAACLVLLLQVYTGFALSWRRFFTKL